MLSFSVFSGYYYLAGLCHGRIVVPTVYSIVIYCINVRNYHVRWVTQGPIGARKTRSP